MVCLGREFLDKKREHAQSVSWKTLVCYVQYLSAEKGRKGFPGH